MNMYCPACKELFTPKVRNGGRHLVMICEDCETAIPGTQIQVTLECVAQVTVNVEIPGGIGLDVKGVDVLLEDLAETFPLSDQWASWDCTIKQTYPNVYGKYRGEE